jgi:aryl-alcohol dehydrogenase-like predicted oxidoreductase
MLTIAVRAARKAGNVIAKHYETPDSVETSQKGSNDFVTNVDKAAEAMIIETIRKSYPQHTIITEESGEHVGVGCIAFSPLAGGQLTDRYLNGIPADSRAASDSRFLNPDQLTEETLKKVRMLNAIAERRGQKLSQMALAWVLRSSAVTSVLIGASKTAQIEDAVGMLANRHFSTEELGEIEAILNRSN